MKGGPLKYHGGKGYLASWIRDLAPPSIAERADGYTHRLHVFAGGLGELWGWSHEGISETANDINGELINFYNVLKNPEKFASFERQIGLTPFAQQEFEKSFEIADSDIESAVNFFVRNRMSRQGLGKDYATPTTRTRRGMNENVSAYLSSVEGLHEFHLRLSRVEIRSLHALDFLRHYDHPKAFFYLDPPYLHSTRTTNIEYGTHEMSPADHLHLLNALSKIEGRFLLSGYPSELYDELSKSYGWDCRERAIDNKASSKKNKPIKTECLWANFKLKDELSVAA